MKYAILVHFVFNHQRNHHINRQPIVEEDAENTRVAEVYSRCCRCPRWQERIRRSADRAELVTMLCRQIKRSRTLPLAESGIFHQFPGFIRALPRPLHYSPFALPTAPASTPSCPCPTSEYLDIEQSSIVFLPLSSIQQQYGCINST